MQLSGHAGKDRLLVPAWVFQALDTSSLAAASHPCRHVTPWRDVGFSRLPSRCATRNFERGNCNLPGCIRETLERVHSSHRDASVVVIAASLAITAPVGATHFVPFESGSRAGNTGSCNLFRVPCRRSPSPTFLELSPFPVAHSRRSSSDTRNLPLPS